MSSKVENWLSAKELSLLGKQRVVDLPTSAAGVVWRAKNEGWGSRKVPCMGGKRGMRTEYQPPAEVLALIQSYLHDHPDFFPPPKKRTRAELASISKEMFGDAPRRLQQEQADYAVREKDVLLAPDPEGRMLMLQMVLRVSEMKLKEPPAPDVAKKIVDLADAWMPYCEQHPAIKERLQALKATAALFL